MDENLLYVISKSFLLLAGFIISAFFLGENKPKRIIKGVLYFYVVDCAVQVGSFVILGIKPTNYLIPLITHLPMLLFCRFYSKKPFFSCMAALTTAYMFCQPSKWMGYTLYTLTHNIYLHYFAEYITLILICFFSYKLFFDSISSIFSQSQKKSFLFAIVPTGYYIADYIFCVYPNFWINHAGAVLKFTPLVISSLYVTFCVLYYRDSQKRVEREQREKLVKNSISQMEKEIEIINNSEYELKLLRHDMRHFLNNIAMFIDKGDIESAKKTIAGVTNIIDNNTIPQYCNIKSVNYVIGGFSTLCERYNISFLPQVALNELNVDEILFTSILDNALENAINAQRYVEKSERKIELSIKNLNDKVLISVSNPFVKKAEFKDGKPISKESGHGYGTQSICHLTKKLNGDCQFLVKDNLFIVRVVI